MDQREERIIVETDRYRITGAITLPRDGYRSRMSDYLSALRNGFVAMTDVELVPLDSAGAADNMPTRRPFMVVGVAHIRMACPVDDAF